MLRSLDSFFIISQLHLQKGDDNMKIKQFDLDSVSMESINKFLASVYVKEVKFNEGYLYVLYFEYTKSK